LTRQVLVRMISVGRPFAATDGLEASTLLAIARVSVRCVVCVFFGFCGGRSRGGSDAAGQRAVWFCVGPHSGRCFVDGRSNSVRLQDGGFLVVVGRKESARAPPILLAAAGPMQGSLFSTIASLAVSCATGCGGVRPRTVGLVIW
jgi:hypothetical protein